MRPSPSPEAFTFLFAAALLAFYFVYLQLRRLRYQKIAVELPAAYDSQGVFKTGEIAGLSHGRRYKITTKVVGRDSATYTILSVVCRNRGIPLSIHGGFFEHFPDWKFAFTRD